MIKLYSRVLFKSLQYSTINNNYSAIKIGRNFCYKSDLSLDILYPNSRTLIYTPAPPPIDTEKFNGYIPIDQLQITYSGSSGPGGQNVNCVNTKVDLRFHVQSAKWLPEKVKSIFLEEYKTKISKDGYFIIKSDLTRSQHMNLADALEKLRNIIRQLEKPKTVELSSETVEKIRRRQEKLAKERIMIKRQRSSIKADRQNLHTDL